MHKSPIEENLITKSTLFLTKKKIIIFLKDLNNEVNIMSNKNNIDNLYCNFMKTLYTSINKFSIEVLCNKENRMINPWYDKECKINRKSIKDTFYESLKFDKINKYKAPFKREKMYYIIENKRSFFTY